MEYTYEGLSKKTVAQLREIAEGIEHEALRGYTTLHKAELLPRLCEALEIEAHEHHEVVGIDKTKSKAEIKALKVKRQEALDARDRKQLKEVRREIRLLKRKIRRATV